MHTIFIRVINHTNRLYSYWHSSSRCEVYQKIIQLYLWYFVYVLQWVLYLYLLIALKGRSSLHDLVTKTQLTRNSSSRLVLQKLHYCKGINGNCKSENFSHSRDQISLTNISLETCFWSMFISLRFSTTGCFASESNISI